jgi:hypothetical protein
MNVRVLAEEVLDLLGLVRREVVGDDVDLKRKLMRYIRQYNKQPKPVKWKYFDPSRRIASGSERGIKIGERLEQLRQLNRRATATKPL